jgi:DNA repair exonuclease SbcCD nuclease subunit
MLIAILGDLHAGTHKDHPAFANALKYFVSDQFIPTLESEGITHVVQLGDVFDRQAAISHVTMRRVRSDFVEPLDEAGLMLHVLVGNHDVPFNKHTLTPSAPVELMGGYNSVTVYDRPMETTIGDLSCVMLPWICRDNIEASFDLLKRTKRRVVFGHLELTGFDMYKGSTCTHGMDAKIFQEFYLVCSGHFHQPSRSGAINYLGAPMQYTWADAGCQRGFWILDTETLALRFIRNTKDMFVDVDLNTSHIDDRDIRGRCVRVNMKGSDRARFDALMADLEDAGAIQIKVNEPGADLQTLQEPLEKDYEVGDHTSVFHDYIAGMAENDNLEKDKLESILVSTYAEALSL